MVKTKMQHCEIKGSVEGEDGLKAQRRHKKEKSAFVLQHNRADKEPRIPDHQAWDL